MSRLRHAAALFIEAGRALGQAEQCQRTRKHLAALLSESNGLDLYALRTSLGRMETALTGQQDSAEGHAARARTAAEASMAALEHPGARLARRLLRAARAARGAWRAG